MLQSTLYSATVALFAVSSTMGQFLNDGNFDELDPGTPPDCGVYAGAWGWPQDYVDALMCERLPEEFEIISTEDRGNSLHVNINNADPDINMHLPNLLLEVINEDSTQTVVFTAEVKVLNEGIGGSCLYVGGGGFGLGGDRGPQICWFADATIQAVEEDAMTRTVVENYPFNEWQTVRLAIDLARHNFDMFWGPDAENLALVATDVGFRSGDAPDFIDRITVAYFGVLGAQESLFDSFDIDVVCLADIDGDDDIDLDDLLVLLAAWGPCNEDCPEDVDRSGTVDFGDLLVVLSAWGPCD